MRAPRGQEQQFEDVVTEAPETEAPAETTEATATEMSPAVVTAPEELDAMQMATWLGGWGWKVCGWIFFFFLVLLVV